MVSGGSLVSWSDTFAAKTVTVQVSPWTKSVSGSRVKVVGPPLTAAVCPSLVPHEIEYQLPVTSTGSVNVIEMFASTATSVAPFAGDVLATAGAESLPQIWVGVSIVRGAGAPATKSAELLSVSWQPPLLRKSAVVFEIVGAAAAPSKKFAPS